jgi:hypothetical protein
VGEGERRSVKHEEARMSEGESAHLALAMAHPARASQRVRSAMVFQLPPQGGTRRQHTYGVKPISAALVL